MLNRHHKNIQKYMGRLADFIKINGRLFKDILRTNRLRIWLVMVMDIIGASSKIGALAVLSLAISAFQNPRTVEIGNLFLLDIKPSVPFLILISVLLMLVFLVGAAASFMSVRLSRKQGRATHIQCLRNCDKIFRQSPQNIVTPDFLPSYGLNKVLTQVCMHTGLATETLLRMIYPVILMVLSVLTIFYLNSGLALFIIFIGCCVTPLYLVLGLKVHKNAQEFYGESSSQMGLEVTKYASTLDNQYRLVTEDNLPSLDPKRSIVMKQFMDNWDKNLLANNVMAFFISLISGIVLPIIIFYMGYMVIHGQISSSQLITFSGAFLYMVNALQTLASYTTNLLRYLPQVYRYDSLISLNGLADGGQVISAKKDNMAASQWPDKLVFKATQPMMPRSKQQLIVTAGQPVALHSPYQISKTSFAMLVTPLITNDSLTENMLKNAGFANARYLFGKATLEENLLGVKSGPKAYKKLHDILEHLGVMAEFRELPDGLKTQMTPDIWDKLGSLGRTSLRIVPLMMMDQPNVIFLDVAVVQSLNPRSFEDVFKLFQGSYIFITITDSKFPQKLADQFITTNGSIMTGLGDRDWFDSVAEELKSAAGSENTDLGLESLLL